MARIELITCDGCGREVEDGAPVSTIAVQDHEEPEGWFTLDLCSARCVLVALGYMEPSEEDEDDEDEQISRVLDELPPHLAQEVEERRNHVLVPTPEVQEDTPPVPLTMDERMENEKRYKEQAAQLSAAMFPVKNKSRGER